MQATKSLTRLLRVFIHNRYPLSAAHPAILPISNPRLFFLLTNLAPGEASTSSSQKLYVTFFAFGEVVISVFGSQSEKYDGNKSANVSGAMDMP